jgi:hypothetical protein
LGILAAVRVAMMGADPGLRLVDREFRFVS